MPGWTALMALKPAGEAKSRLAKGLDPDARRQLRHTLFVRVLQTLASCARIERRVVLAADRPDGFEGQLLCDRGRGLNIELQEAAATLARPLLVIHPDLPLLRASDLAAFLDAAENEGCALAPDRHRIGTNAVALADNRAFAFNFGPDSLARHRAATNSVAVVQREGLSLDCDTEEDLALAEMRGFAFVRR